ncbi:MAG: replication factor C large subunit [Candidatus Micrarchaeota archaeon]|nr:replication factor C large subunit [Candidatus Micrarchaeota archaeon]
MGIGYDLYDVGSLDEIIGNERQLRRMRDFSRDVNNGVRRQPLMVYGPPGTGKSVAVSLLARESNWNVVELNASDYRDRESIEGMLAAAATSRPIFGGRNLILLDEIDEIVSGFDKGAGAAIVSLIGKAKNPVIFTANNMWDQSITFLRNRVDAVEFKRLSPEMIERILTNLCRRFSISASKSVISMISNRANGDARSAINDMSAIMGSEDEDVTEAIGLRDRKKDVFNALDKIFLTNTISSSLRAIVNMDVTNDMMIKWIDENIPRRYTTSAELRDAFGSLSDATVFSTRAMRAQYYTYWRYMNVLMSSGVALSKGRYPSSMYGYAFPKVIKEMSVSKSSRGMEREIAAKLQRVFHSSIKRIVREEMRMLSRSAASSVKEGRCSKSELSDYLMSAYLLDEKETRYLLGESG